MYRTWTIYGETGSFLKKIIVLALAYVGYNIFGMDIFTEVWFYIFEIVAYWFTGWFLRTIGFWWY